MFQNLKMKQIRKIFCFNLRRLIKDRGYTAESFAERYDVTTKYIEKLMYYGQWPSDKTIARLAKALNAKEIDFFSDPKLYKANKKPTKKPPK